MEIQDNIQWHPAFCSAMELELRDYKKFLRYEREHNLSKMPLKIDFLVIKKTPDIVIKNEIGDFFLGTNIFEYKSPGDDVNAGTFYKVLAYACLYKSEAGSVEEILNTDITISLVREEKPEKLLGQLGQKYKVTKKADGIYRVTGMIFPTQIVVTGELDQKAYVWVTSLTRNLDGERARRLLDAYSGLMGEEDGGNADSVLNVTLEANVELFKRLIQEGDHMCEELKELLAPEIAEFKTRLADKDAEISKLKTVQKAQLADKDAKLADKDAKLADKDAKLADKDVKLADKEAEITKLKTLLANAGIQV